MREYILSVATAAVISALSEVLIPKSWQKYAGLLTGALLLLTLIKPLMNIRGIDLPEFSVPEIAYSEYDTSEMIKKELEANIERDIKERIKAEFKTLVNANVSIRTDEEGAIAGVHEIALDTKKSPLIGARLQEIYAPDKITWRTER